MRGKTPPNESMNPRERRTALIIGGVLTVLVVGGLVLALALGHSSDLSRSNNGCVVLIVTSSMGGSMERACGNDAQTWCAGAYARTDATSLLIQHQCGLAGIARKP